MNEHLDLIAYDGKDQNVLDDLKAARLPLITPSHEGQASHADRGLPDLPVTHP